MQRLAAGSDAQAAVTAREVSDRLSRIPSVESVAVSSDVPLAGSGAIFFTAEGQPPVTAQNMPRAYLHRVGPNFFQTLRIRILAGRTFSAEEMKGTAAAVVTDALVKRFWPGQNPIGKRVKFGPPDSTAPWIEIVGVVNDMKYRGLPNNPTADPDIFVPFSQQARQFAVLMRTALPPESIGASVRRVVHEADRGAVVFAMTSLDELVSRQTAGSRFTGWLMGIFAASALLLAMIGIYGVMAYSVARRTQEIGIRVALGAARGDVLGLVVRRGMTLIAAGLALGIAGALVLSRVIATLLYGITARDSVSFVAAALMLALVALFACLIPASRAARIHPAVALRNE
jgi:putative ABC transport system permease protein